MKRERWNEADVDGLPLGESDSFDRKSGRLFENEREFSKKIAKAISAFANSGGGSLILGVADDGTPDGLPPVVGRTSIHEWLEQKIPALVDYPLSDFRVHIVEKSEDSRIPPGKEVVVVDIGDSAAAPHQSVFDKLYYRREAGHSKPAPHFYLELLRQRLTNPALEFSLRAFQALEAYEHEECLFVGAHLQFEITNVGRVAAYDWQLKFEQASNDSVERGRLEADLSFTGFPRGDGPYNRGIPLNRTILPGCVYSESRAIGFRLRPKARNESSVQREINTMIVDLKLFARIATETSPGTLSQVTLANVIDSDQLLASIRKNGLEFFNL